MQGWREAFLEGWGIFVSDQLGYGGGASLKLLSGAQTLSLHGGAFVAGLESNSSWRSW